MIRRVVPVVCLVLAASSALAWGPIFRRLDGPIRWSPATNVAWSYDGGSLGQWNTNTARNEVQDAVDIWEAVPTASITYSRQGQIRDPITSNPIDVTSTNFISVISANDGQNPIVYDNDHDIIDAFMLPTNLAGFTIILRTSGTQIQKAVVTINGDLLNGNPLDGEYPIERFRSVIVHELGHFNGLAHSSLNHELAAGIGACPVPDPSQFESMTPFSVDGITTALHNDDEMGLSHLYPAATFNTSRSRINGHVLSRDGVVPRDGANVVLRPITAVCDDLYETSQSFQVGTNPGEFGGRGSYEFPGLIPGTDYSVFLTTIQDAGAYPYGAAILGGPDEFYNGANEGHFDPPDLPTDVEAITAPAAGITSTGLDILINNVEGPTFVPDVGGDALLATRLDGSTALPSELLILDALYSELFVTVNPPTAQLAWVNRFTPRTNQLPMRLERIETGFDRSNDVTGRAIRILVYNDPAGTGDMANATLIYTEDTTIPAPGLGEGGFDFFTLASPVTITSGEFYVGFFDLVSDSIDTLASFDPVLAGAGLTAANSTAPGDFVPWDEGNFYIRARVTTTPPANSIRLTWGDSCNEATVLDQDFVVYEGTVASLGGVQDHEPASCTTERMKRWVVPPGSGDLFWLVTPRVSSHEGDQGAGTGGIPRTPASTCATVSPETCP